MGVGKVRVGALTFLGLILFLVPRFSNAQAVAAEQYYKAGGALYAQKNYTQAAQYYGAAIKLNPNYAEAYQGIGSCYYAMGNKQYALAYFQKALQLNPNNTQLSQFVQSLGGQAPAASAGAAAPAGGANPLAQGTALFQQKQYTQAISYFQQAIQQNPNDYRPYYYAGYSYYMTRDNKNAALYFAVANQKQPNASIKAYADRIRAGLTPDDQRWVDDQVGKLSQGGVVAQGPAEKETGPGVHILIGGGFLVPSPQQILDAATAAKSVGLSGTTPDAFIIGGAEGFYKFSPNLEADFGFSISPVGILTVNEIFYDHFDKPATGVSPAPVTAAYTYNTSMITPSFGLRYTFGDPKMKFYIGGSADISLISLNFSKSDGGSASIGGTTFKSSGSYSTMGIGGHVLLGVDLPMGQGLSVGSYLGYRFMNATDLVNGSDKLMINSDTSDVGPQSQFTAWGVKDVVPLKLDYSTVIGGINVTFTF